MVTQDCTPLNLIRSARANRSLLGNLAKREILAKYKDSLLGVMWSILGPLLMLTIFSFVFSNIFKSRWGIDTPATTAPYPIILFAGLIIFNLFAECLGKAPSLITQQQNFVKKIVFPLELLPLVAITTALFQAAISFAILLAYILLETGKIPASALLLPVALLPLIMFLLGILFWLSATGVFIRDISQTVGLITTGMMFISPIFFPLSSFPENWRFLAMWNPLTFPIESVRGILVFDQPLDYSLWSLYLGVATAFTWCGFVWFQKLRTGFADVL